MTLQILQCPYRCERNCVDTAAICGSCWGVLERLDPSCSSTSSATAHGMSSSDFRSLLDVFSDISGCWGEWFGDRRSTAVALVTILLPSKPPFRSCHIVSRCYLWRNAWSLDLPVSGLQLLSKFLREKMKFAKFTIKLNVLRQFFTRLWFIWS